jgi:hypothetical protein
MSQFEHLKCIRAPVEPHSSEFLDELYEITEPKAVDSLKLTERPTPKPGLGEVVTTN